ncbi:MAG: phosphoribosylformylglycinamidine synthase subunit PurS [Methanobacteriaceae archaeon]|nr:phosphoribosylformylglycinamidine synthase subunit PurS [Methanobacteriaceae archaeon]
MKFDTEVIISLKDGMLNPEASTIEKSLALLNYDVENTNTINIIKFTINCENKKEAELKVEEMCQKLLCNPVIHNYEITINDGV